MLRQIFVSPSTSGAWREARSLAWAHRRPLAAGFALMVVNRLAGLVLPLTPKVLIDEVVGHARWHLMPMLAIAVCIATLVQMAAGFGSALVLGIAAQHAITNIRRVMHRHVTRLPVGYFDSTTSGATLSRILNDTDGIRNLLGNGVVELFGAGLTAALSLIALYTLNWRLAFATTAVLALFGVATAITFGRMQPLFRARAALNAEVAGRLAQMLSGIRTVKAYKTEKRETLLFVEGCHRQFRNVVEVLTGMSGVVAVSTLVLGMTGVIMILVGGTSMRSGAMTVGDFVTYLMFTALSVFPIIQLATVGSQMTEALAALERMGEIRHLATEDENDLQRNPLPRVRGDIEFDDVSFAYAPGQPVLSSISFRARSGTTTALVGASGAGKSTIASLVMAFRRPVSGRVLVDGTDLTSVRLGDFRASLGVVFQDTFLFDDTIAENIAYASPRASSSDIVAASRAAHCHEFIERFEQGYNTRVGERGVRLSGGQRQRVAIARAILADPKILILDEATSTLDSESEEMIQLGLKSLRAGRTTLVIAHRLSTIRSADQILVLDGGNIVERGTHETLMATGERYRKLYERQHRMEIDRLVVAVE